MRRERGFTLVEMLVATAVGSIVIASGYASYEIIAKQNAKITDVTGMQSSSRSIMRIIERDIRMAGFEWRDSSGTVTYGSINDPIAITDSGNKCCDEVTVVYDYHNEATNKTERHKIRYWLNPYKGRNRLYRKRDILQPKARAGGNEVLADYVEDLQFSDPADDINPGFVKLDATGNALPESATQWSCVKDNNTGLTWETKRNKFEQGLHSSGDSYIFQVHPSKYGYCFFPQYGKREGDQVGGTYCTVPAFTARVNSEALCGFSNWRLPSVKEFEAIATLGNPALDPKFFPNSEMEYHTSSEWKTNNDTGPVYVRVSAGVQPKYGSYSTVSGVYLVTQGEATTLISMNLILRTKQQYGPARSYAKKDHFGGNYKINKNDGHKREEYSSTVLVRNAS